MIIKTMLGTGNSCFLFLHNNNNEVYNSFQRAQNLSIWGAVGWLRDMAKATQFSKKTLTFCEEITKDIYKNLSVCSRHFEKKNTTNL